MTYLDNNLEVLFDRLAEQVQPELWPSSSTFQTVKFKQYNGDIEVQWASSCQVESSNVFELQVVAYDLQPRLLS